MKKYLITFLFILILNPDGLYPDNNLLYIWTKDGNNLSYKFEDRPVIYYSDESMVLKSNSFIVEYPLLSLHKFTFDDNISSGINDFESKIYSIEYNSNHLYFKNFAPYSIIKIYRESGQLISTEKTDQYGTLQLSIESLNKGLFIVKTEVETYKFIKI